MFYVTIIKFSNSFLSVEVICRCSRVEILYKASSILVHALDYLSLEHPDRCISALGWDHKIPASILIMLQLDWPCVSGVPGNNLPPSRGPNSLFFSGFDISRAFPIYWRRGYLIFVLVEKVNILISFNIGFFELATMDSDSEDHVLYIKCCSKIS